MPNERWITKMLGTVYQIWNDTEEKGENISVLL